MAEDHIDKRKDWIDVLRALAMIFVIYGHLLSKTEHSYIYYVFTSPIKIPLFFAISGYLFKPNVDLSKFLIKILKGLVVPWLSLTIIPVLLISIIKGGSYLTSNLVAIVLGRSFWYMPCCIIAEIVFYFVIMISRDNNNLAILLCGILSCIGVILIKRGNLDYLMINRALSVQLFLILGSLIRKNEGIIDELNNAYYWIGLSGYVLVGLVSIILFSGQNLDIHQGIYYNIPICTVMVVIGCFMSFALAKRFDIKSRVLCYIGKNTLLYYILSNYAITIYNALARKFGIVISNIYVSALIESFFVCCLCAVFALILNSLLSEIMGMKQLR